MKHTPTKITLFMTLLLPSFLYATGNQQYLDALSTEASQTDILNSKQAPKTESEPEPDALPSDDFDGDKVSIAITSQLSGVLQRIKSGEIKDEDITKALEKMVASALLDGVDMDQLRSVVDEALTEIHHEEGLKGTEKAIMNDFSGSIDKLLAPSDNKHIDSSRSTYLNSINVVVSNTMEDKTKDTEPVAAKKPQTNPTGDFEEITVLAGESLYTIALRVYGSGDRYLALYNANKDRITDPNLINVGQILRIPK